MAGKLSQTFLELLAAKKRAIVRDWLARTLQTYPEHTSRFLSREKDPFRNPVGHSLKEAFPALVDELIAGPDASTVSRLLDPVMRIRAVQDFTAAQAVAFVFLLKQVVREALKDDIHTRPEREDLAALDARIDEMVLVAFDLFMQCRERIYEIKAGEAKRRLAALERMQGGSAEVR